MSVLVIIFMVIATIFALASLGYVTTDVVMEVAAAKKAESAVNKEAPVVVAPVAVEPEPQPQPEPVPEPETLPEIVECIDAEEADSMIPDDLAMETAIYESGAGHGKQGIINIGVIDQNFEADAVVTLADLQQKGLIPKNVGRMKVLAHGTLSKPLTVKAESYSVQAIKMIELTGGTPIILTDD